MVTCHSVCLLQKFLLKGGYGATQGTFLLPPKGGPVSQANLCPRLSRRGLEHSHCGAGSRTRRADALQRPSSEQRCIWHGQAVRVQVMAYIRTAPSPHPSASDPAIRTSRLPGRISHPRRSTPQKPPSVSLPSWQEEYNSCEQFWGVANEELQFDALSTLSRRVWQVSPTYSLVDPHAPHSCLRSFVPILRALPKLIVAVSLTRKCATAPQVAFAAHSADGANCGCTADRTTRQVRGVVQ